MIFCSWPYKNELSGASNILFCTSKKWGGKRSSLTNILRMDSNHHRVTYSEVISKNVDLPKNHRVLCFSFWSSTLLLTRIIKFHHFQGYPTKKTCMKFGVLVSYISWSPFDVRLLPTWWTNLSRNLRSFLGYFLMFEYFTEESWDLKTCGNWRSKRTLL